MYSTKTSTKMPNKPMPSQSLKKTRKACIGTHDFATTSKGLVWKQGLQLVETH